MQLTNDSNMKQLHEHEGKIVLIDWIKDIEYVKSFLYTDADYKYPYRDAIKRYKQALESAIPTLEQDRSTWLEISEKCGGKLEEGVHYTLHRDKYSIGLVTDIAIPTPQEDLWEEAFTKCSKELYIDLNQVSMFIQVKEWFEKQQEFSLTRKS